jgi:hypothetical protein
MLHEQSYVIGSRAPGGKMFSDLTMQGYLGPVDIIVRNGTGASIPVSNGTMTVKDAITEVDAYFRVDDLDFNWDNADLLLIFNFAAMTQTDTRIHNMRGNDAVGKFGFANISAKLAEGTSTITGATGLALYDVEIRADVDMPNIQFGNSPSIGGVNFTDFVFKVDTLVYGH